MTATFFLAPGLFGNRDERLDEAGFVLTEAEARELAAHSVELGAHTMYHPDVRDLGPDELAAELAESKRAIEELSGRKCDLLAWPFGLSDEPAQQVARDVGFEAAFSFSTGPWLRYAIPRQPAGKLSAEELPQYAAK
ncbi:MAG: polysaccharide deacetylase family protein [Actinobacteria bacterium]|nr:polysaccharide deacetylase family protein [Actinomycetota bacterium]